MSALLDPAITSDDGVRDVPRRSAHHRSAQRLAGWMPFRVAARDDGLWVDWCHLGQRRMVEPFHYETIVDAMREPFNLAFQQATPIDALGALPPAVPVAGLIFHMSRCGSTLLTQMLAALDDTIVVAEATPLRTVLRAHAMGRASTTQATAGLRGLVTAYGQKRFPAESRLVVKFMAGDVLDIALVRAAFPGVPWIFVTRDPAEILASQKQAGGIDLMRGQISAARLALTEEAMWRMDGWAYKAHVLAYYAQAGLAALAGGGGMILDHSDLPGAAWTTMARHFGLDLGPEDIERMRRVGQHHSKRPREAFDPVRDPSRTGAAAFRDLADRIVGPTMAALDKAALDMTQAQLKDVQVEDAQVEDAGAVDKGARGTDRVSL